jgi:hypothetical protein
MTGLDNDKPATTTDDGDEDGKDEEGGREKVARLPPKL